MSGPAEGKAPGVGESVSPTELTGDNLRSAFQAATRCLERQKDAINSLNVFPVPDGDTGTNMLLTMRSVTESSQQAQTSSVEAITGAMAHGALMGARGNSGVILSQFFHGLAQGLKGGENSGGQQLVDAFALASKAADGSVSVPVDGTMLTVLRELSYATTRYWQGQEGRVGPVDVWRVAVDAGKEALARTPLQLRVLREAGVVDAGGQGVVTLLEGAWHYLVGNEPDEIELEICAPVLSEDGMTTGQSTERPVVDEAYLAATEADVYGYCTQFMIQRDTDAPELDVSQIRGQMSQIAGSTVVVGGGDLVKVHVHATDPGPVVSYAVSLGTIAQVSMDNMDEQHGEFVARHRDQAGAAGGQQLDSPPPEGEGLPVSESTAVVAVVSGDGFAEVFKQLGCGAVVPGGQTMNPSTQELLDACAETGAGTVILLANNPNIIAAARQAASVANGKDGDSNMALHVIPSRTAPQGVAALLAFNPEGDVEANLESMNQAVSTVKTVEVTKAVREVTLGDVVVKEGQHIGLLDGELVASCDGMLAALDEALKRADPEEGQLVTLYWGADVQEDQAADAASHITEKHPGVDVEIVYGGQPFYQYVASLE